MSPLVRRTAKLLATATLAGIIAVGAGQWVNAWFAQTLKATDSWVETAVQSSENSQTHALFRASVEYGFLTFDIAQDRFILKTTAEIKRDLSAMSSQKRQAPKDGLTYSPDATGKLLSRPRGPGPQIRAAVERANAAKQIIGLRSNLTHTSCALRQRVNDLACAALAWDIQPLQAVVDTGGLRGVGRVEGMPHVLPFNALTNRSLRPVMTDLTTVSVYASNTGQLQATPPRAEGLRLDPLDPDVVIDVIGASVVQMTGPAPKGVRRLCWDGSQEALRTRICPADTPEADIVAWRFRYDGDIRDTLPTYSMTALTIPKVPPALTALHTQAAFDSDTDDKTKVTRLEITDQIALRCALYSNALSCDPQWRTNPRDRRVARDLHVVDTILPQVEMTTADGSLADPEAETTARAPQDGALTVRAIDENQLVQVLSDGTFQSSPKAESLGLASVLGTRGLEFGSYLSVLGNLPSGVDQTNLELSIDPDVQETVHQTFQSVFADRGSFGTYSAALLPKFDDWRRGAFVMLDLQHPQEPGAIVAVSNYPTASGAFSLFDAINLAKVSPADSPLTAHAWAALDSRMMPGSTAKILTALALMDSATGRTEGIEPERQIQIRRALLGQSAQAYNSRIGLDLTRTPLVVRNRGPRGGGTFSIDVGDAAPITRRMPQGVCARTPAARDTRGDGVTYGLCEATARSSNIWFSGMSLYQNDRLIEALYQDDTRETLFVAQGQTLRRLGMDKPLPLVRTAGAARGFGPRAELVQVTTAPGLDRSPYPLPRRGANRVDTPHLNLALDAYGQGMSASPLALAALAASVGSNAIVHPWLAREKGVGAARPALYGQGDQDAALMAELRAGMKAVVQSPGGTAFNLYNNTRFGGSVLVPQIFAKTGTPILAPGAHGVGSRETVYGSWFMGWMEDASGAPKYAFACAVTHLKPDRQLCPAITKSILNAVGR